MKKAFTLIELLVVIAIIAILAAILFPVFTQAKESAKDTQMISGVKQAALGHLMYASDNDDQLVLAVRHDDTMGSGQLPLTWQRVIQPYVKSYSIFQDVKMPGPSSTVEVNRIFQISQHMGVPTRALAVVANTNQYFETGPSWAPIVGATPVRFDGIFGVGIGSSAGGYVGLRYRNATTPNSVVSLSNGALANPSDIIMVAGAANYDMWFGNGKVVGGQATWCNSGYGAGDGVAWSGTVNITGPHARKLQIDGNGNYQGACKYPNGSAYFGAADGSAKTMNLKRVYLITSLADGTRVFHRFWPTGGDN